MSIFLELEGYRIEVEITSENTVVVDRSLAEKLGILDLEAPEVSPDDSSAMTNKIVIGTPSFEGASRAEAVITADGLFAVKGYIDLERDAAVMYTDWVSTPGSHPFQLLPHVHFRGEA